LAEDLANRDAQISGLRRRAEERERALRKILSECGLSNLDVEKRLREVEEAKKGADDYAKGQKKLRDHGDIHDMMNEAMSDSVGLDVEMGNSYLGLGIGSYDYSQTTLRPPDPYAQAEDDTRSVDSWLGAVNERKGKSTVRGWKDYLWGGTGTSKKSSKASSVVSELNEDAEAAVRSMTTAAAATGRRTVLQNDLFQPPENGSVKPMSRTGSIMGVDAKGADEDSRKSPVSMASMALKLVAGSFQTGKDDASLKSGRTGASSNQDVSLPNSRPPSVAPPKTVKSLKSIPVKTSNAGAGPRRSAPLGNLGSNGTTKAGSVPPAVDNGTGVNNLGPVEMDTILPPETRPPTLTQPYNNNQTEFLTDRFGFIYDQRRKKRQREAAESLRNNKRSSRTEMLSGTREGPSTVDENLENERLSPPSPLISRPESPMSAEEQAEDGKPAKRWQDYLQIATFRTELLAHTPSSNAIPTVEMIEGSGPPKSGIIVDERGSLPTASPNPQPEASTVVSNATFATPTSPIIDVTPAAAKDQNEPVKLLLEQLTEVHDTLQQVKTVKWNEFLRKVRAERRREGEAAATADSRSSRAMAVMPEVSLADGEVIGVAGLGNKGKVGRAKWKEFKTLVLGGIPVAYRAKIWSECSGASALRVPGYYDDLVRSDATDPTVATQISMDINRTLTDNIFFRKGPGVVKLSEVLLAYSRRNPEVGYCQGMNLIAANLLLIMPTAEDAFWILTSMIENILPQNYYDHSLLTSRADQQVLRQYVAEILPKLSAHLEDLGIELEALTFQWFLSVFTDCLSAEALFRVWDVVLCTNDGSTYLFQLALALLKLNEKMLFQCQTAATVYGYINHQMTNHAISIDGLILAAEGLKREVRRDVVEERRAKAVENEKKIMKEREERNKERKRMAKAVTQTMVDVVKAAEPEQTGITEAVVPVPVKLASPSGIVDNDVQIQSPMPMDGELELGLS
jgi:hypothetical protein